MLQHSPELLGRIDAMRSFDEEHEAQLKPPPYLLEEARQHSRQARMLQTSKEVKWTLSQRLSSLFNSGWGWTLIGAGVLAALFPLIDHHLTKGDREHERVRNLRELYSQNSHHGVTRAKGGSAIWEVYRAPEAGQSNRSTLLKEGAVIYPGQRIGFRLYPKQHGYYMIIGRDSAHNWYLGAPQLNPALSLDQHTTREISKLADGVNAIDLKEALEFDDRLGREELFLFFCQKPVSYGALHKVLKAQQKALPPLNPNPTKVELPAQCKLSFISLDKQAR